MAAARSQVKPPHLNPQATVLSLTQEHKEPRPMTTTSSRVFDELAKLMNNAAGAAQGLRREIDTLVQAQVERVLNTLDVVKRDEFEAVREMAAKAREENERLNARLAEIEKRLDGIAPHENPHEKPHEAVDSAAP
jgi:BMFP domain-containing protein YqiC